MSMLLGLAPRPLISEFSSQSSVHEILMTRMSARQSINLGQFHERITWVDPGSGDTQSQQGPIIFQAAQLSKCLFDIYIRMFANEDYISAFTSGSSSQASIQATLLELSWDQYDCGTFAAFVKIVKGHVLVQNGGWDLAMDGFLKHFEIDPRRMVWMHTYQDLCVQLHLHGLYTGPHLSSDWCNAPGVPKEDSPLFRGWKDVPPVVCLVLTVPRSSLKALYTKKPSEIGTPVLQVKMINERGDLNVFSCVHGVPGRLLPAAQTAAGFMIEEDDRGLGSAESFVFTCWIPSWHLTLGPTEVSLCVKQSPGTTVLMQELGIRFQLFKTNLEDKKSVRILRERPNLPSELQKAVMTASTRVAPGAKSRFPTNGVIYHLHVDS